MKIIPNLNGDLVLSQGEFGFQPVLDDFNNAEYINIVTYNIKPFSDAPLINELKKIDVKIPINIILNIPARQDEYKTKFFKDQASQQIYYYMKTLEREQFGDLNVYFNFINHAKLVMTNNIAYIGSQNFSDWSSKNFEAGFIVRGGSNVRNINSNLFKTIKSNSTRYSTSEYIKTSEKIRWIMEDILAELRMCLFTFVGDEPFIPEIEIFDIEHAVFPKEKWEEFSVLHNKFSNIMETINEKYKGSFNVSASKEVLSKLRLNVKTLVKELNELANFKNHREESMMWEKFREWDTGDEDLNKNLNKAMDTVRDYKVEKFHHINEKGESLLLLFNDIEDCIERIINLIEEIKYEMIKTSVYENLDLIDNTN